MRVDAGHVALDELIAFASGLIGGKQATAGACDHHAGGSIDGNAGEVRLKPRAPSGGQATPGFDSSPDRRPESGVGLRRNRPALADQLAELLIVEVVVHNVSFCDTPAVATNPRIFWDKFISRVTLWVAERM